MAVKILPNTLIQVSETEVYGAFTAATEAELSAFNKYGGFDLADGCTAIVVPTGKCCMISGGTWYKQDGTGAISSS